MHLKQEKNWNNRFLVYSVDSLHREPGFNLIYEHDVLLIMYACYS